MDLVDRDVQNVGDRCFKQPKHILVNYNNIQCNVEMHTVTV